MEPATPSPNPEVVDFLARLYEPCDAGFVTLFAAHPDGRRVTRWATTARAADLADHAAQLHGWNIWFGCATRRERLDGGARGGKDDCVDLVALWVDIDIAGAGHATNSPLPDEEQAFTLLNDFPLVATVIIESGHGLQAWWALQEPHALKGSDLLQRWGATWARRAAEAGFHLDNVYDDARIMRLPGTINTKAGCPPVPVTIFVDDWRNRYGTDDIDQWLDAAPAQPDTVNHIPYIGPGRPGDAYNARHTTAEQLAQLGFIPGRSDRDGSQHWKWPAAAGDQSATTWADGHATIWSETAAAQLGARTMYGYDPYGLYADTQHHGDHAAAARHLAANGYGTPPVALESLIGTTTASKDPVVTHTLTVIDQTLIDAIEAEYGITGPEAWRLADNITIRIGQERATEYARRLIRDTRLVREADLDGIVAISTADLMDMPRVPRVPVFGALMASGHNATVVARWKVGKSTFIDNAAIAAASAGLFLGRFEVPAPLRVVIFNYELHNDDMADRLRALDMPGSAAINIVVVNLRGRRLPLMTDKGRALAVRMLRDHGAELWLPDPFGAAFASAGGEDENSNAEVRRFLIGLDEIKRLADCPSLVMPVHTGRANASEGDEQGRGATVLEDWPDVRILLTKGAEGVRYLRTEGRAWELEESRLSFDPLTRRLTLATGDVGVSRRLARISGAARAVVDLVYESPGITKTDLRDQLADVGITNTNDKDEAITAARHGGTVHVHRSGRNAHHHYVGAQHADADLCPGGWKP